MVPEVKTSSVNWIPRSIVPLFIATIVCAMVFPPLVVIFGPATIFMFITTMIIISKENA